ncbi:SDR family NAD(P)-dependent oxidoreductase [Planosporangium mesophilum]|uniref:SDR family NAD(P)-dependent oxidoreductase n=1 Tax=Planosporangium mesophilum TaxID=689768 RepID=UPI0014389F56|nr:SDR family NAD(P)-dependent oxidoreductase [Planosporangium mesophilum]NJC81984.1 SDR family NAD(P)-dependent oxidoreductase [Planosporangium mesophilum]
MTTPVLDLEGRVALVTGASGGIGTALARRLAGSGVDLALTYTSHAEDAERLGEELSATGRRVTVMHADFTEGAAPRAIVRRTEERLGPVDLLVAAAGMGIQKSWDEVDFDLWEQTMAVNLRSPFFLAQHVLPGMVDRGYGRILFFSSVAAFTGGVVGPHYAASKSGLHGMTHFLASRVADAGVTVNAIAPALIGGTRMLPANPHDPGALPLPIPVGRLGTTDEVADLAMAMLRNGYLTSKVIALDGGLYPY